VNQQTSEKSRLAALRTLNTDTMALRDKAEALTKASTWQTVGGTVTGAAGVTVKVAGTAGHPVVAIDAWYVETPG